MSLPINTGAAPSPSRDFGRHQRMGASKLVLSLLVAAVLLHVAVTLRISAFNIQHFGKTKMNKTEVANNIVKIVKRYDITLVQEVLGNSLDAMNKLQDMLNRGTPGLYNFNYSAPLGQSNYKERYLFIWRNDSVNLRMTKQIGRMGVFSRPPYVVKFYSPNTQVKEFVMVPLHSKPDNAVEEIDKLYDVYNNISTAWKNDNIILLGDFNAGCSYVNESDWSKIRLRTQAPCDWLIKDDDDTTVTAGRHCPYDRIVVCGDDLKKDIEPGSGRIYNFEVAFNLTNKKFWDRSRTFGPSHDSGGRSR
ncbi:deoxyribonuclease-1-like [Phaenicophaeus curvirostris]|uniref:deoxyribonuclease-1-like n=1 Tax=Phaenicophaeus curvirostris TaxID=33595 RepID=UPI0037F0A3C9